MAAITEPTVDNGQAALLALSNALTLLARRLRNGSIAAEDFARLMARAKSIAAHAREMRTSRWAFVENAAKLADALVDFAHQTQAASARATAMVFGNVAVIETLETHAARIAKLHTGGGSSVAALRQAIRAELEPLEATLGALRARLAVEHRASEDAEALARRAASLAECALDLREGGRSAETAAEAIHKTLSLFVADASTVAERIARAANSIGFAAGRLGPGPAQPNLVDREADGLHFGGTGAARATLGGTSLDDRDSGSRSGRQW